MIAIVENGVFKGAVDSGVFNVGGINYRVDDLPANAKALGIYEFIHVPLNVPAGKKAAGTTKMIDAAAGTVTEVWNYADLTADEIKANTNTPLLAQIAVAEKDITERRKREAILTQAGKDWLAAADASIAALRATLV